MFSVKCFECTTGNRRTDEVAGGCVMSRLLRGVPAAGGSACRKHGAVTSASSSPLLHLLEKAERGGCPGPI